ncbi:MAG: hypothetical protein ABII82_16575 [Verrucomicrobiota bacterium]
MRPPLSTSNRRPADRRGFALLITITLVAFLVLILVSLATLTRVETQVASNSQQLTQARQNALMGLQIALGQLQKHAGPDQRVTVPATTVYPSKDVATATGELFDLYRARAQTAARNTYLTPAERVSWEADLRAWWNTGNRNPHWIAAFDSSLRRDASTTGKYGEPKRDQLPVWLVSGNERLPFDPATATSYPAGYFTPDVDVATLADPADIIDLVNSSAPAAADSVDGLSGAVRVVRQPIDDAAANTLGHYAYWVADESTKANFTVRDPYYSNNTPSSDDYRNRLQVPQRVGWERLSGFAQVFDAGGSVALNDPAFEKVLSSQQLPFLDPGFAAPAKNNFHHLTTASRSLHTDTALGGLKKDLTVFLEGSGSGLNASDPIPDRSLYAAGDPRFGANNAGFPNAAGATANLPTWGLLKDWFDTSATGGTGTVPVAPGRAPVIANYQVFFGFSHENGILRMHWLPCVVLWNPGDAALASTTYRLKWRHNFSLYKFGVATDGLTDASPADTSDGRMIPGSTYFLHKLNPLDWYDPAASNYKNFGVSYFDSNGPWDATSQQPRYRLAPFDRDTSDFPNPSAPNTTWVTYEFTTGFAAGQAKVFTVGAPQKVTASSLHSGTEIVQLANTFDPDLAESYFFDVAGIVSPDGTGLANLTGRTVRFFAERLGAPGSMSMELSAGGQQLWRNEYLGSAPNFNPHLTAYTSTNPGITANNPAAWRKLHDSLAWQGEPKDRAMTDKDAPVIGMYHGYLLPFALSNGNIVSDGNLMMGHTTNYQRAFAAFNLAAPSLDLSTDLEQSRSRDAVNNTDGYGINQFIATGSGSTFRWDTEHTQVNGSDVEGFALLSRSAKDARNNLGLSRLPLRQVKRASAKVLSLGQFQQANLSRLVWQPSFPLGNSEATAYADRARIAGLESYDVGSATAANYALYDDHYRAAGKLPNDTLNRYLDLSYLLNEALWDRSFLSGIPQSGAVALDNSTPLANSRHRFLNTGGLSASDVRDYDTAAAHLENLGALNVNSTSVEAWKALLTAFRGLRYASDDRSGDAISKAIPVSRTLDPSGGNLEFTFAGKNSAAIGAAPTANRDYTKLFTGFRYLTDDMIQTLAERIVDEVRLRGPFYSLSDFVNRRLVSPDRSGADAWLEARTQNQSAFHNGTHAYGVGSNTYDSFIGLSGLNGTLQRALNVSGINGGVNYPLATDNNDRAFRVVLDPVAATTTALNAVMQITPSAGHYLDTEHLAGAPTGEAGSLLSHAPGFVTQADLLGMIGPALTARGDTFLIRTYGDTVNPATGEIAGRAWLEAVVQRTVDPVEPAGTTGNARYEPTGDFGRRFAIVSLRWLGPGDL